jgi:hypothetical protein
LVDLMRATLHTHLPEARHVRPKSEAPLPELLPSVEDSVPDVEVTVLGVGG